MQHLYISYPDNDYVFAHRLVDDLQAVGYSVFVDAVSNTGTMAWAAETRYAIRSAGAIVMILSPAEGRRVGTRHEGILARRAKKTIYVVLRSPGELPRYLLKTPLIDFAGDYDPALAQLLAKLPSTADLLAAPDLVQRRSYRPPHQQSRCHHRIMLGLGVLLVISLCVALGIAFGVVSV